MARVQVVHDDNPDLLIDLADDGEDDRGGACTGCDYTVSEGGTRRNGLADAVHAAIVHLDHQH